MKRRNADIQKLPATILTSPIPAGKLWFQACTSEERPAAATDASTRKAQCMVSAAALLGRK